VASKVTKVSDINGDESADYGVVVREYPDLEGGDRLLDVTKAQAEALTGKAVRDVLQVEVRQPDGSPTTVLVSKAEIDKWLGSPDALKNAAYLRGRRPGTRPADKH
jgi:hypothetical protein